MLPLSEFPVASRRAVRGVFFDIDDTLTTDGALTAPAYAAMERLKASGRIVVPITGRPAGWCDHIARMWPVDAVVGENGAFYFAYDRAARRLLKRFRDDEATRAASRLRLAAVRDRILIEDPGAALASDQLYREADLAIDWCEDVPRLDDAAIDRIVAIMREAGMTAKVSSIHVNGWFGDYDKLTTSRQMMSELFGVDIEARRDRYVFSGDSPNDAPMFGFFWPTVGVSTVVDYLPEIPTPPAWITQGPGGAGFVEAADAVLRSRLRPAGGS